MGVTTTPINGFTLPDDNELLRNVYAHVRGHALQLETALRSRGLTSADVTGYLDLLGAVNLLSARVDALPRGRKGSVKTSTVGPDLITAETMYDPVTFTAEAGRRYRLAYDGMWVSNTAQSTAVFRMRWAAGSSVTTAGALLVENYIRAWAFGEFIHDPFILPDITGLPAGPVTVAMSVARGAGTGTITIPANVSRSFIVEDIGAV